MGNRAVITASKTPTSVGIYLHWNGGLESVQAFLDVAKARGFRDPASDESYAMARLTGLIHEFFGVYTSTSVGIGALCNLDTDNFDNGTYVIGDDWRIVERYGKGSEPITEGSVNGARATAKYGKIVSDLTMIVNESFPAKD